MTLSYFAPPLRSDIVIAKQCPVSALFEWKQLQSRRMSTSARAEASADRRTARRHAHLDKGPVRGVNAAITFEDEANAMDESELQNSFLHTSSRVLEFDRAPASRLPGVGGSVLAGPMPNGSGT
jgi:hypothetical protein